MVKFSEKVGYGFGDFASSMFWKIFIVYLPFFYSNVFGLKLTDAALLVLITKLWDAISDPMMGIIADRTKTRWGRYRPYLLWVAVPFAIVGILLFTTPSLPTYAAKLAWAYVTYILMMTVYTAINVPYGAMLGVMSSDSKERTILSSFRMFFAYGGSFVALAIFEPIRDAFPSNTANVSLDPAAWQFAMIVIASICLVFFLLTFFLTKERVVVNDDVDEQKSTIIPDLKALVGNGPWWTLLAVCITTIIFSAIRYGAAAYYFSDRIGDDSLLGVFGGVDLFLTFPVFLLVGEVANMVGVAAAVPLSKWFGKKGAFIMSIALTGVFSVVFYFLTGKNALNYWLILVMQVIISIGTGVTLPLVWSMFADVADYSEHKTGRSTVGLIFSSSSMAQKFGGAIASYLVLMLLAAYGYQTPVDGVAVEQSALALNGLNDLMSWVPALICPVCIGLMVLYPLNEKKMEGIRAELTARRGEE